MAQSIVGSFFDGSITEGAAGSVHPHIKGSAFVNAEAALILDPKDPFVYGIPQA